MRGDGSVRQRTPAARRLERVAILALTVAAHTVWLSAAARALLCAAPVAAAGTVLPSWWLAALLTVGYVLSGLLGRRGGRLPVLGLAGLLAVCLVLGAAPGLDEDRSEPLAALGAGFSGWYEGLPPGVPVALVAGLAWGLGVLAGRDAYDGAWLAFWIGVVGTGGLLLLAGPALLGEVGVPSGLVAMLVALTGLAALALRGVCEVKALERARFRLHLGVSRPWLAAMGLLLGLLLVGGWVAAQALSPDLLGGVWAALGQGLRAAYAWAEGAYRAAADVCGHLLRPLMALLARLLVPGSAGPAEEGGLLPQEDPFRLPQEGERDPAAVGIALLVGAAALGAWGLGAALAGGRRRHQGRLLLDARPSDERETVWSTDLLGGQLGNLVSGLRRRRRPFFLPLEGTERGRRAVRLLDRRDLQALRRRGGGRAPGVTPGALARGMAGLPGEAWQDLLALTAAYEQARYGPAPPAAEEVRAAERAWQRLGQALP
jgi:hypothetical protein